MAHQSHVPRKDDAHDIPCITQRLTPLPATEPYVAPPHVSHGDHVYAADGQHYVSGGSSTRSAKTISLNEALLHSAPPTPALHDHPANGKPAHTRIGNFLVAAKAITVDALNEALTLAQRSGIRIG